MEKVAKQFHDLLDQYRADQGADPVDLCKGFDDRCQRLFSEFGEAPQESLLWDLIIEAKLTVLEGKLNVDQLDPEDEDLQLHLNTLVDVAKKRHDLIETTYGKLVTFSTINSGINGSAFFALSNYIDELDEQLSATSEPLPPLVLVPQLDAVVHHHNQENLTACFSLAHDLKEAVNELRYGDAEPLIDMLKDFCLTFAKDRDIVALLNIVHELNQHFAKMEEKFPGHLDMRGLAQYIDQALTQIATEFRQYVSLDDKSCIESLKNLCVKHIENKKIYGALWVSQILFDCYAKCMQEHSDPQKRPEVIPYLFRFLALIPARIFLAFPMSLDSDTSIELYVKQAQMCMEAELYPEAHALCQLLISGLPNLCKTDPMYKPLKGRIKKLSEQLDAIQSLTRQQLGDWAKCEVSTVNLADAIEKKDSTTTQSCSDNLKNFCLKFIKEGKLSEALQIVGVLEISSTAINKECPGHISMGRVANHIIQVLTEISAELSTQLLQQAFPGDTSLIENLKDHALIRIENGKTSLVPWITNVLQISFDKIQQNYSNHEKKGEIGNHISTALMQISNKLLQQTPFGADRPLRIVRQDDIERLFKEARFFIEAGLDDEARLKYNEIKSIFNQVHPTNPLHAVITSLILGDQAAYKEAGNTQALNAIGQITINR